MSTIVI